MIHLKNISKTFIIPYEKQDTLKERFIFWGKKRTYKNFHALKDISFEVKSGECVGIVGQNGSGKSTLLKIMAGIYQPDHGTIKASGNIVPFLELGVGFQPELTARDNIWLNGALLGLSRTHIKQKLHEIVEFAGVEPFLDLKIKNFSSGMQARLAFAIAMQADADIYLCDEVLAVGDEHFQNKCREVFKKWQHQGKTIVLVSHNPGLIQDFCSRVILLDKGHVIASGEPEKVLGLYHQRLTHLEEKEEKATAQQAHDFSQSPVQITEVRFFNQNGAETEHFKTGDTLIARIHFKTLKAIENPVFGVALHSDTGLHITGPNTKSSQFSIKKVEKSGYLDYIMKPNMLLGGRYDLTVSCFNFECTVPYDYQDKKYHFTVGENRENQYGVVELPVMWRLNDE